MNNFHELDYESTDTFSIRQQYGNNSYSYNEYRASLCKTMMYIYVFLSMHIDRYCNTEATASVIRQHIPGSSLLKQNEEQLIYALPFKDMDKFSGITFSSIEFQRKAEDYVANYT